MNTDKKQALSVHLKAIRRMLIVSVASVAVLFVLFFYLLCGPLVDFVLAPVRARGIEVITTSVSEALMMQFKVCLNGYPLLLIFNLLLISILIGNTTLCHSDSIQVFHTHRSEERRVGKEC